MFSVALKDNSPGLRESLEIHISSVLIITHLYSEELYDSPALEGSLEITHLALAESQKSASWVRERSQLSTMLTLKWEDHIMQGFNYIFFTLHSFSVE